MTLAISSYRPSPQNLPPSLLGRLNGQHGGTDFFSAAYSIPTRKRPGIVSNRFDYLG